MKLSLCMITLNSESTLRDCLDSIAPFVDELSVVDTGSTDDTEKIVREFANDYGLPLIWSTWDDPEKHPEHGWISDFAKARNLSVDQCTGDVFCWIDADTRLKAGREWRDEVDAFFGGQRGAASPGIMTIPYDYEHDDNGRVVRVVVAQQACLSGAYRWEGPVHELPIPQRPGLDSHHALHGEFRFEHIKSKSEFSTALDRNLWLLKQHQEKGREMTPRLWQNLGATEMGLGDFENGIISLNKSMEVDPMTGESYASLISLGCCYRNLGNAEKAFESFLMASRRFPERRTPYVYLAETAEMNGEYERALQWLSISDKLPDDDGSTVYNPAWLKWGTVQIKAKCLRELGMMEAALDLYQQISQAFPENEQLARYVSEMISELEKGRLYRAYKIVTEGCDEQVATQLWKGAPDTLQDYPEVVRLHRVEPGEGKRRVVIYCPAALQKWGPNSLEGGVGGSEEAVIFMSRQLTSQGFHVEVYGQPDREDFGVDDHGVVWLPQYAWEDEPVDVFISWRHAAATRLAPSAKIRALWLHDVVDPALFTEEVYQNTDVVFCLTKFHAQPLSELPGWGDKIVVTKNGMDPSFFVPDMPRKMHSFAYYSSPDRGLDLVLELWPKILEELPDATMDVYYGFTPVYKGMMARSKHLTDLKAQIETLLEEHKDSVTMHGMVGQEELAQSMASTEFWLYPTSWPETSCITAMKVQAMGCIPITSRYEDSGVPETTQFDKGPKGRPGMIRDDPEWQEDWVAAVLDVAKKDPVDCSPYRSEMSRWSRKTYSWEAIAKDWALLFRTLIAKKAPVEIES